MVKKRVAGAIKTPKSDVENVLGVANRKHAKNPDLIKEVERILRKFQKLESSGEILDWHAAFQQFRREIEAIGVAISPPAKDPGIKTGPVGKRWVKCQPKEKRWTKKKPIKGKRQFSKWRVKK